MSNLKTKQKIIIIFIVMCIISIACYVYSKTNEEFNIEEDIKEQEVIEEKDIIIIHLAGAVNREGIVELEKGKRISDAIEKCGGLKENADLKEINLACVLEDGDKIYIPFIEENIETNTQENIKDTEVQSKNMSKKVNINTADQFELETLTGIGPSTALKIIAYRKENGKFSSIEQIKEVNGIGEGKYEKIKDKIEI